MIPKIVERILKILEDVLEESAVKFPDVSLDDFFQDYIDKFLKKSLQNPMETLLLKILKNSEGRRSFWNFFC